MDSEKVLLLPFSSFPRKRESSYSGSSGLLLPAFAGTSLAGMTAFPTFYEIIKFQKDWNSPLKFSSSFQSPKLIQDSIDALKMITPSLL